METAQEALKKIPLACKNLGIADKAPMVANYIHNLLLTCLKDSVLQRRLHEEPIKLLDELSKL